MASTFHATWDRLGCPQDGDSLQLENKAGLSFGPFGWWSSLNPRPRSLMKSHRGPISVSDRRILCTLTTDDTANSKQAAPKWAFNCKEKRGKGFQEDRSI